MLVILLLLFIHYLKLGRQPVAGVTPGGRGRHPVAGVTPGDRGRHPVVVLSPERHKLQVVVLDESLVYSIKDPKGMGC